MHFMRWITISSDQITGRLKCRNLFVASCVTKADAPDQKSNLSGVRERIDGTVDDLHIKLLTNAVQISQRRVKYLITVVGDIVTFICITAHPVGSPGNSLRQLQFKIGETMCAHPVTKTINCRLADVSGTRQCSNAGVYRLLGSRQNLFCRFAC